MHYLRNYAIIAAVLIQLAAPEPANMRLGFAMTIVTLCIMFL